MPTFREYFPKLEKFFKGADMLVCHNAPFDVGMLQVELRRMQHVVPGMHLIFPKEIVCTVQEYAPQLGKWPKMEELYQHITGNSLTQAHRALDDCIALLEILIVDKFFEKVINDTIAT